MRRFAPCLSSLVVVLFALGCQQSGPTAATSGAPAPATTLSGLPAIEAPGATGEGFVAGFHVVVDGGTLSATVTPWREGQVFQGLLADLDANQFQTATSFRVLGVRADPGGNVILDWTHAHPFAAPDPTAPASSINRADLGYSGRAVFLVDTEAADIPANTFFGTVIANPRVIFDADGYVLPGDLLASGSGYNTTAMPYKLLADDGLNNRVGRSNGGQPDGNYDAVLGGWQGFNAGTTFDGWTGYDYVHQGQTIANSVTITKAAFEAGTAEFDVALLVRYSNPKATPVAVADHRFPKSPVDVLKFAYRLPHMAMDCSEITPSAITLETTTGSNASLNIRVRDWDARATESTQADLGLETEVGRVAPEERGSPQVTIVCPALFNGTLAAPEAPAPLGSGVPGDEINYNANVSNLIGTATPGVVYGFIRVIDPEQNASNKESYHLGVDADTLAGDPDRAVPIITYQTFRVTLNSPPTSAPSCGSIGINGAGTLAPGGSFTVNLATAGDPDSASLDVLFNYEGAASSVSSAATLTVASLGAETAFNPFTDPRLATKLAPPFAAGSYQLFITLDDGTSAPTVCGPFGFSVSPDFPPNCGTGITLSQVTFFTGQQVDFTTNLSALSDPGNTGSVALTFSYTGPENDTSSSVSKSFPLPANFNPFSDPGLSVPLARPTAEGTYAFKVSVDDGVNSAVDCLANFEIRSSANCGTPNTATDIIVGPAFGVAHDLNTVPATYYNYYITQDFAAFKDGTEGYVVQRYDPPEDPDNGAITNYDLWHFTDAGDPATATRLTNYFSAGNQVAQLEIDQANRFVYFFRPVDDDWSPGSFYGNSITQIHWFNYTGSTVTAAGGSITLLQPPVAIALDFDDSLWIIDKMNRLHHYGKLAGGYVEILDDQVNLGTLLGINTLTVICDFVIDFHNGAKYILATSGPADTGRLYRVECEGTLWTGGTNPVSVPLSVGKQFAGIADGGDIDIDQVSTAGAILDGPQDAQIVIFHSVGTGGALIFNAEMEQTAGSTGGVRSGPRGVIDPVNHLLLTNEFDSTVTGEPWRFCDHWTLPGGWQ